MKKVAIATAVLGALISSQARAELPVHDSLSFLKLVQQIRQAKATHDMIKREYAYYRGLLNVQMRSLDLAGVADDLAARGVIEPSEAPARP